MEGTLLESILTQIIAPLLTAVVGWLIGRRRSNAEAVASELANVEKSLAIYRGIIADLEAKVERLEKRIIELTELHKTPCTCQKQEM